MGEMEKEPERKSRTYKTRIPKTKRRKYGMNETKVIRQIGKFWQGNYQIS